MVAGIIPGTFSSPKLVRRTPTRLVAAGLGVCLTSSCVSKDTLHRDVALVPVAGIARRRILAALPSRPRPTAAVSAVLEALQNSARNMSVAEQMSRSGVPQ